MGSIFLPAPGLARRCIPDALIDQRSFGPIQMFLKRREFEELHLGIWRLPRKPIALTNKAMLLWREPLPKDWLPKVLSNLPAVLIDHAHLERKAATTALNLEKYRDLYPRVDELNAIAIEELQHFQ